MHQRLFASGNEEQDIIVCTNVYFYPPTRLISSRIDQRILEIEFTLFSNGINRELASFILAACMNLNVTLRQGVLHASFQEASRDKKTFWNRKWN